LGELKYDGHAALKLSHNAEGISQKRHAKGKETFPHSSPLSGPFSNFSSEECPQTRGERERESGE
jgi:hypothetical protein